MFDWFWGIIDYLRCLLFKEEMEITIVGLQNSGKQESSQSSLVTRSNKSVSRNLYNNPLKYSTSSSRPPPLPKEHLISLILIGQLDSGNLLNNSSINSFFFSGHVMETFFPLSNTKFMA